MATTSSNVKLSIQGLRFNSSLLFLHTKHSGYIDGPLLYRLVIHGMIGTFTAILTKREGALHFFKRAIRFAVHRVGFRLRHKAQNDEERF